ncbi:excinuclease ABC subunit UvrA [bacterium]|nr:excinuclease ABC subunit UvrA [bacterium]
MQDNKIVIKGANQNNLKNVSLELPKNKLIVFTGVSGSGKSSLAFDTLYAEGQRRYVESLSSYARQFLGIMEKPDVESITGLSPAISIDQKTTSKNPRSTVGTITEIYGYLRLLYGHIGTPHCPKCGETVQSQTIQQIADLIESEFKQEKKFQILSPLVKNRKGEYSGLFDKLLNKGFLRIIVDGNTYHLDDIEDISIDKNKKHNIELIVDRLNTLQFEDEKFRKRLIDSLEVASNMSDGEIIVRSKNKDHFFSEKFTCFNCNLSYPKMTPTTFSFNSPEGACPNCTGLGHVQQVNVQKIYNPSLTILEGGIFPWATRMTKDSWNKRILEAVSVEHGFDLKTRIQNYPTEIFDLIFFGKGTVPYYKIEYINKFGRERTYDVQYEGVVNELIRLHKETASEYRRLDIEKYMEDIICHLCNGQRLKPYSLAVRLKDKNIIDLTQLPISELKSFLKGLKLEGNKKEISKPILKEINSRLEFLTNVGLNYLTLSRKANTLSGGESQRIRLASQIGTGLSGVLYVLDEPSIGLHPRDVNKLLTSLENLRDSGNTVIVVEHDEETMHHADHVVDIGPKAGIKGGSIVAQGDIKIIKHSNSYTAKYLNKEHTVGSSVNNSIQEKNVVRKKTRIHITGVSTHNLKHIDLEIPLNTLTCITGVSGSGKSSLINDTLYPALMNKKMNGKQVEGEYEDIDGLDAMDKVIGIDQSPIGRTPRSNPATYTGVFTPIRELFAQTQEARARGYKAGRFSFNVKGGRCEKCRGDGQIKVEMQFLPNMYITCDQCNGKRYNEEALDIDYKGKNISDVLNMTVDEALIFFKNIPTIFRKLNVLQEVGLGYIKLGQSALTLSGGESQRIKLSKELAKMTRGHTVYILDEPTTGLHFYDVDKLLILLRGLVEKGDTVIIIEHNLDVIKQADWIIDLGPDGGENGGNIVVQGSLDDIKNCKQSYTGQWLKKKQ